VFHLLFSNDLKLRKISLSGILGTRELFLTVSETSKSDANTAILHSALFDMYNDHFYKTGRIRTSIRIFLRYRTCLKIFSHDIDDRRVSLL